MPATSDLHTAPSYNLTQVDAQVWHKFDGLFLSNSPGDLTYNVKTIEQLKRAINVPEKHIIQGAADMRR
jgi:carbamoylphosphate synthase small subunit